MPALRDGQSRERCRPACRNTLPAQVRSVALGGQGGARRGGGRGPGDELAGPARTRSALVRHIGRTPYIDCTRSMMVPRYSIVEQRRRARLRTTTARPEPIRNVEPFTWAICEPKRTVVQAGRLRGRNRFPTQAGRCATRKPNASRQRRTCPEDDRARLLAHVARTPYLQTG